MHEPEILRDKQAEDVLKLASANNISAIMTYMASGKWHTLEVGISGMTGGSLHIALPQLKRPRPVILQINQPLGVTFQHDFNKFIIETVVIGIESSEESSSKNQTALKDSSDELMSGFRSRQILT